MQRHKSAEKAARKNKKANEVNRARLSRIKTAVNLIHANNAANKKARLSKYVNSLAK
jgi:ribosomal protein S20